MGLESESAYPYKAADGTCTKTSSQYKAFVSAWHQISTDETQIAAAVQQYGPLSIGINANTFQNYRSGVANPLFCNPSALDHGVAIVGFGTDSGKAYWTIRNRCSNLFRSFVFPVECLTPPTHPPTHPPPQNDTSFISYDLLALMSGCGRAGFHHPPPSAPPP